MSISVYWLFRNKNARVCVKIVTVTDDYDIIENNNNNRNDN